MSKTALYAIIGVLTSIILAAGVYLVLLIRAFSGPSSG